MSHTLGPWHVSHQSIPECATDVYAITPSRVVAVVYSPPDAELISAAPDLLKAAKDALDWFNGVSGSSIDSLTKLKEAINKAENRCLECGHDKSEHETFCGFNPAFAKPAELFEDLMTQQEALAREICKDFHEKRFLPEHLEKIQKMQNLCKQLKVPYEAIIRLENKPGL